MRRMTTFLLTVLLFALAACNFADAKQAQLLPTSTTVRVVAQVTPVPTINRHMQTIASPEASEVPTSAPSPTPIPICEAPQEPATAQHTVVAWLDYRQQSIDVEQGIVYVNRTTDVLPQFLLDVEPNRLPGVLTLETLTLADGAINPDYELTGRRLTIDLPEPLAPGCTLQLDLHFHMQIPQIGVGQNGFTGYFGFSARQINLGHWLPAVVVRQDSAWLLHDEPGYGEQTVFDPANWDVTLTVEGASDRLEVVGPGEMTEPQAGTWHFVLNDARDFTASMSERFNRLEQVTENGVTVELYTFDDAAEGAADAPEHALEMASLAIAMYSDLFGNYPHDRFVIVQGDFPDGMEFSDMVFVSGDWFRTYPGDATGYLTIITVHEVAHQWWYSRVGNDQALTPWMDEALATYSEFIFYEEYYPEYKDWWWRFRVAMWIPEDFDDFSVASTVYEFTSLREYINAVYLRGARMLDDLRGDIGTEAFFDWLHSYAEAGQGQIATPDILWSLLSPAQDEATRATRERYLSVPEVVEVES
jgi:hypothetical protein